MCQIFVHTYNPHERRDTGNRDWVDLFIHQGHAASPRLLASRPGAWRVGDDGMYAKEDEVKGNDEADEEEHKHLQDLTCMHSRRQRVEAKP